MCEAGFSVAVRWPSVGHAAAYVIEFREAWQAVVNRFTVTGWGQYGQSSFLSLAQLPGGGFLKPTTG